ncbi:MAG: hypothetical protein K1Y01_04875 [Vicinamibacteria bacterium]|nr:hypothetical protein [Vicinamibacteria bacterium]
MPLARAAGREPQPWVEALLYSALSIVFLAPQSLAPASRIAYVGDSLESVAIVGFLGRQILSNPTHLFDAGFLHPQRDALTLTDHRLLPSLLVAPALRLSGNPVLAYNLALLVAFVAAAFGGRSLARALGLGRLPAGYAGALFAFHTYAINEAPRLNIVSHAFVAFALGSLVEWLRTGANGSRWRFALFLLLQGYCANYHLLYGVLLSSLTILIWSAANRHLARSRISGLVVPGAVAVLLFTPILVPYLRTMTSLELARSRPRGIDLLHYLSTSPSNWVWGAIGPPARLQQQGPHFVGFAAVILGIAGLFLALRLAGPASKHRAWAVGATVLTLTLVLLSLGDRLTIAGADLGPGPYGFLYDYVPGFRLVRIPERLALFVMLGVGLLGAVGLERLVEEGRRTTALFVAAAAVFEHLSPLAITTEIPRPGELPAVYKWLSAQPSEPVAEIPIRGEALIRQETIEMFFATFHGQREPLGYTAYPTLLSKVVRRALLEFPSEACLTVLDRIGVHRVIVHEGREVAPDLRNQIFNFGPQDRERRFAEAVADAGLDVERNAASAARTGRLLREARFAPWAAGSFSEGGESVYRFASGGAVEAAPLPRGTRVAAARLRLRTKEGDATAAFDGRMDTSYVLTRPLRGDEFIETRFAEPIAVSGVELVLRHESAWPTRFRIAVLREDGQWIEAARWDGAHLVQLVEGLLQEPRRGTIGFSLNGERVLGVSLLPQTGGTSASGWSLPEFRILEKP